MVRKNEKIYTVVEVIQGIADDVHSFKHFKNAQRFLKSIKKKHNLDENDVQIFEGVISE